MRRVAIALLASGLLLAACGAVPTTETTLPNDEATPTDEPSRDTRPASDKTPETILQLEGEAVVGEVPGSLLDEIITAAMAHAGAARSDVSVTRAESVLWNDGSLGCPEPGQNYLQVLTNGYWVELEVAGESYDYRSNEKGYFKRCTGPSLSPPTG